MRLGLLLLVALVAVFSIHYRALSGVTSELRRVDAHGRSVLACAREGKSFYVGEQRCQ